MKRLAISGAVVFFLLLMSGCPAYDYEMGQILGVWNMSYMPWEGGTTLETWAFYEDGTFMRITNDTLAYTMGTYTESVDGVKTIENYDNDGDGFIDFTILTDLLISNDSLHVDGTESHKEDGVERGVATITGSKQLEKRGA
jgi:hypothetical protein